MGFVIESGFSKAVIIPLILQFKNEKTVDVILLFFSAVKYISWIFNFENFSNNVLFKKVKY